MSEVEHRLIAIENQIKELVERAEEAQSSDPDTAMWKARKACETICRQVCAREELINAGSKADNINLDTMIQLIGRHEVAPRHICDDMRTIQWKGNTGTHVLEQPPSSAAVPALAALANVSEWYFSRYGSSPFNRIKTNPDEPEFIKKSRKVFKNQTFGKVATGVMVGTAVALGVKLLGGRNNNEES
jgi:hypothetical protein